MASRPPAELRFRTTHRHRGLPFQRLKDELRRSRDALAERKIIDRAKGVLMNQRGMSEAEAYARLRRSAMSQSQRIVDVARSLLAVADLLKP